MKIIIVDTKTIKLIDIDTFDKVYLVGYGKDNIDKMLDVKSDFNNVEVLLPTSNFDKAYKLINKHIATLVDNNIELLSLFKLCKQDLFNIGMIMIALDSSKLEFQVSTQYNEYLIDLNIVKKENIDTTVKVRNKYKINIMKQMIFLLIINLKVIFMYIKSFFIKQNRVKKLLMDYSAKKVLGNLLDEKSLLIQLDSYGEFISYSGIKIFFKYQRILLVNSLKYKILYQTIAKQSYYLLKAISIADYYNPKVIIGALDASANADIYSMILKEYNIKFGCYSHGYNYDFRTEYIYIPFDFYFVWSKVHLKQIQNGMYFKNNCKFYITGSPFYKDINFKELQKEQLEIKYDILVIGEYYYNDYSVQPFNAEATKELVNVLNNYKNKYNICIRPRANDAYYQDMYNILGNDVDYSIPENEATTTTTIIEDIQASKVIISTFSGGIHDALLLYKPVIQTNFIGIKEPKYFDSSNVVYYTTNGKELEITLDDFFNDNLEVLDYDKHNEYFFNEGKFDIIKVKKIVDDYI